MSGLSAAIQVEEEVGGLLGRREVVQREMPSQQVASRQHAQTQVNQFVEAGGGRYDAHRNYDHGPADRGNVSILSPYVGRRMVLEREVVKQMLQRHTSAAAEKFVQEICWRTYWKGWMELHPTAWSDYLTDLVEDQAQLLADAELARRYEQALEGSTGVECFDAWVKELQEFNYLHNHARMWFASIWIFTLDLPWVLGADLFYRTLLDADAASNTLSWRWVAGIQTRGKHYVATAENIAKFTDGRFDPRGQLNENPTPQQDSRTYEAVPLQVLSREIPDRRTAWLISIEDLHPAYVPIEGVHEDAMAFLQPATASHTNPAVREWNLAAISDAAEHARRRLGDGVHPLPLNVPDVVDWVRSTGAEQVVAMEAQVGETRPQFIEIEERLARDGVSFHPVRRRWDEQFYPHATRGFFRFRRHIPDLVRDLCT